MQPLYVEGELTENQKADPVLELKNGKRYELETAETNGTNNTKINTASFRFIVIVTLRFLKYPGLVS